MVVTKYLFSREKVIRLEIRVDVAFAEGRDLRISEDVR
jgi:hypothetical protein